MIGGRPRPFIFIHVPKCGGTSVETALLPIFTRATDLKNLSQVVRRKYWLPCRENLQHAKLVEYGEQFALDQFFKFAFVRNPWDRAISQIEYLTKMGATKLFCAGDYKEKLRVYCRCRENIWGHDLAANQSDYLASRSGVVDFVGRFERLRADFAIICNRLGLVPPPELPHLLQSSRAQHYSAYYDEESIGWIRRRFACDIDVFGYEFEKAPPRVTG